jgi:hypothetical protein
MILMKGNPEEGKIRAKTEVLQKRTATGTPVAGVTEMPTTHPIKG